MFIINVNFIKPIEEVDHHLEAHRDFLKEQCKAGKFIFTGRKVPRVGGMILTNKISREEAEEIMSRDPFVVHQITEYELIEIQISLFDERFRPFIDS